MENHLLEFACTGVENGGAFSAEHTGRGLDVSPEFVIKNLSPNAQTIAKGSITSSFEGGTSCTS